MKNIFLFFLFISFQMRAQTADELIKTINQKFALVHDYKAKVKMQFNLPGIRINALNGMVLYKQPNKFKIKAEGIFFLPKENPMQNIQAILQNTSSYTALISSYEVIDGKKCAIVNIIPLDPNLELTIGKFWISLQNPLIYKSEITTKNNGTIRTKNFFGLQANLALPDKMQIEVEMKKFKIPKILAADLKKNSNKNQSELAKSGMIYLNFSDYKINKGIPNQDFDK